jgi:hypothetical protein
MVKTKCCASCHTKNDMCLNCLSEEAAASSKKEWLIHLGYLTLHLIQMILIVGLVK